MKIKKLKENYEILSSSETIEGIKTSMKQVKKSQTKLLSKLKV
jgi:hypothetical protein